MIMNGTIMKNKPQHQVIISSKCQQQQSSSSCNNEEEEEEEEELVRQQQQQGVDSNNKYTCSICQETYFDQLKFFGHLKAHYEFPVTSLQQPLTSNSHEQSPPSLTQQQQQQSPSSTTTTTTTTATLLNSSNNNITANTASSSPSTTLNLISDYQAAEILIEASTSSNIHLQQSPVITATRSNASGGGGQQHHQQTTHRIVAVETPGQGGQGSIQVFRLEHPDDDQGRIVASGRSFTTGEIEFKINPDHEDIKPSREDHHQGPSLCVVQEGEDENQTESSESQHNNKPTKVLLKCSKCRRTFRREKTYQTHVESCQKPDGWEESGAGTSVSSKPKTKRTKVKVEATSSNLIGLQTGEEDEMNDDESDGFPMEHDADSNDGHLQMEEDPLGGDDEDFLDDSNVCPICDELYTSRANLEAHVSKAHPDVRIGPRNSSSIPPKGTPKKKKLPTQKKQEVLKCSECSRIFNHRNSLVYHMRSHTGERPHQCDICGKSFFATSALKVHMRLHSGEKPYKCEHCHRNFRQWGDLKYHVISIHSDIRQYQCEYCGKDFARKYSLIVHRRIHTGERNYKCEFCDKAFRAASYLQNHRRIHTGEKPHACSVCGKPFRVRSDMKRHMASHNRDQHGHHGTTTSSMPVATSGSSSGHQSTQGLINGASNTVINVSNANSGELMVGPSISQLVHHSRVQTIEVPVTTSEIIVGQQQITIDDGADEVISGDITEGTPINITLQDGRLPEGTALSAASVAALQESDLPDGVIYQNRDGQMEVVTLRESTTGTLYVWPVFMN